MTPLTFFTYMELLKFHEYLNLPFISELSFPNLSEKILIIFAGQIFEKFRVLVNQVTKDSKQTVIGLMSYI